MKTKDKPQKEKKKVKKIINYEFPTFLRSNRD